jgi:pyrimidine-specific ribonucleoside hydrolase
VSVRPGRKPVLIDTDAGVDDALAIVYAMHSPEVQVEAITTVAGNVEVDKCTRNVHTVLRYTRSAQSPLVVQGAYRPLRYTLTTAPEVHGNDGLGNTQSPLRTKGYHRGGEGAKCIRDACDRFGQDLTIVALGPLTNVALALARYPRSLRRVKRIVSMGGAFQVPGNTGPVAEFNYFVDPHAAHAVLHSGLPLTVVPLDVTQQLILLRKTLKGIVHRTKSELGFFIQKATAPYMHYHKTTLGFLGGYLHDPMAVAIAVHPVLATTVRAHVEVECESPLTRGMTVVDFRLKPDKRDPEIVVGINLNKFKKLFEKRVLVA